MAFEHRPGGFTLFPNEKKTSANSPDYWGDGLALDGTPIRVSAWTKHGSRGDFLSGSIQLKTGSSEPRRESKPEPKPKPASQREFDDSDAPF